MAKGVSKALVHFHRRCSLNPLPLYLLGRGLKIPEYTFAIEACWSTVFFSSVDASPFSYFFDLAVYYPPHHPSPPII